MVGSDDRSSEVAEYRDARIDGSGDAGGGGEDHDNAFERLLEKIKLRFGGGDQDDDRKEGAQEQHGAHEEHGDQELAADREEDRKE